MCPNGDPSTGLGTLGWKAADASPKSESGNTFFLKLVSRSPLKPNLADQRGALASKKEGRKAAEVEKSGFYHASGKGQTPLCVVATSAFLNALVCRCCRHTVAHWNSVRVRVTFGPLFFSALGAVCIPLFGTAVRNARLFAGGNAHFERMNMLNMRVAGKRWAVACSSSPVNRWTRSINLSWLDGCGIAAVLYSDARSALRTSPQQREQMLPLHRSYRDDQKSHEPHGRSTLASFPPSDRSTSPTSWARASSFPRSLCLPLVEASLPSCSVSLRKQSFLSLHTFILFDIGNPHSPARPPFSETRISSLFCETSHPPRP